MPPEGDQVARGHEADVERAGPDRRQATRPFARVHAVQVGAGEGDAARQRHLQAGEGAQQGGFAGAIGPDEADELARRGGQFDAGRQGQGRAAAAAVADTQCGGPQRAGRPAHEASTRRRLRRRSRR